VPGFAAAGGYAVLKGIQKGMALPDEAVIPSFASLRDMGNTSSSTTWYTIAYLESQGMVKKGHQIMQVRGRRLSSLQTYARQVERCATTATALP
jgi:predicted naringenin-chalcone synthase